MQISSQMPRVNYPTVRPSSPTSVAPPMAPQASAYVADLRQVGQDRLLEYKNLGKDLVRLLTTNPATTLGNLYRNLFGSGEFTFGKGVAGLVNFVANTVGSFIDLRIKPYVTAIKEGDVAKIGALMTVDFLDFVTFAALFRGIKALKALALGGGAATTASVAGQKTLLKAIASDAALGAATWMGVHSGVRQVLNTTSGSAMPGMPGMPGAPGGAPVPRAKLVEDTAQILRQNGIALNPFALSLLSDPAKFSEGDIKIIQDRALAINTINLPFGTPRTDLNPGNPAEFRGQSYPMTTLEIDYLRWLPEDRFQAIKSVCDQADGYNFYKRLIETVPEDKRKDLPRLVSDLRTYAMAMKSLVGDYRLVKKDNSGNWTPDPALDQMITMQAAPRDVLLANIKALYPGLGDTECKALLDRLWRLNPVGERSLNLVG